MTQLSFENLLVEQTCFSVTDLTRRIKLLLESTFDDVLVQGEISNFHHHSSGHMYFSLKDENAQVSCMMWRSRNESLIFTPEDGMKVIVKARVAVYEKRGVYQLDVLELQPAGVGELQLAFEQLKKRLFQEGLFDPELKKPLPPYPARIGIVTSPTGAAIQDLISVLRRRFPPVEIVLNPVRVQGEGAAAEIAHAIDEFNEWGQVDVIIVGRGGGSLEDLWAFNEEVVARAVFRSTIPVVSAVGHEVDFTICDFVADLRAPTPSAAAELVVPGKEQVARHIQQIFDNMTAKLREQLFARRERLESVKSSYGFRQPVDFILQQSQRLDEMSRGLTQSMSHKLEIRREILAGLGKRLALLEHRNVLKRGYSLCFRRPDGRLITRSAQLQKRDELELQFFDGNALTTVDEIISKKA